MPSMDWETFQDAHYRPHLVITNLESRTEPEISETRVSLLERLAATLSVSGCYAFKKDGANVYAAFESDVDAARFASALLAKTTTRDSEWASTAVARMDHATQKKITAALKQNRLNNVKKR